MSTTACRRGSILNVLAALLVWSCGIQAATLRVAPGEPLQAAIDRAAPGDVVEVERAYYDVNLRIAKPLTLRGIGRPTLSGGQRGNVIDVQATDVTIEGLIVRDSGHGLLEQHAGIYVRPGAHRTVVRANDLVYNLFGLWIEDADDVRIEHNLITGLRDVGSPQRGRLAIQAGESFNVPPNSNFDLKVHQATDYCCSYID